MQEGQLQLDLEGYHQYWNYAEKKDIRVQRFLRKKSLFQLYMEWGLKNMTTRGE